MKIINDDFKNYEKYNLEKGKLILTDIPYCIGKEAYASNPRWWKNGKVSEGKSEKAESEFFKNDNKENFNIDDFLNFCEKNLLENGSVIVFCSYEQQFEIISKMKKYGFKKYIPLVFIKNNSSEVLKANMRIVGACEYGLQLIKNKLPEFNNEKTMIKNWFNMERIMKKIHPNQKPVELLKQFIKLFTNEGDYVIDCCMGSGSTYRACLETNRNFEGFEILEEYFNIIKEIK